MKLVWKKWSNLASRTKVKAAKLKKTQPGYNKPAKDLIPLEEHCVEILYEIAVSGLKAGVDTLDGGQTGEQSNSMSFNDSSIDLSLNGDTLIAEAIPALAIQRILWTKGFLLFQAYLQHKFLRNRRSVHVLKINPWHF